jgi:PAS domain S-box-containing protein
VLELQTLKKDGTPLWVEVKVSPSTDVNGKPVGVLGVTRDISKRKATQEELRKLSRAVIQSPNSISITDVEGNFEYINPQFFISNRLHAGRSIGQKSAHSEIGETEPFVLPTALETILAGNDWHGEFQNRKKNGDLYWVKTIISPLVNDEGKITHFVAVKEDITERKKMEKFMNCKPIFPTLLFQHKG